MTLKALMVLPLVCLITTGYAAEKTSMLPDLNLDHISDPLGTGGGHGAPNPHALLSPVQHAKVALQHRSEGRIPEAIAVLNQAIPQYPEATELRAIRADMRRETGDLAGALADIEKAASHDPENANYRVTRSQLYLTFERVEEAMRDLDKAVELTPDLVAARFNRGTLLAHQGQYEKALTDFDVCVQADPHLAGPYFNRGSVFYNMGREAEAVSDIERFINLADAESWKQSGRDLLKVWEESKIN